MTLLLTGHGSRVFSLLFCFCYIFLTWERVTSPHESSLDWDLVIRYCGVLKFVLEVFVGT